MTTPHATAPSAQPDPATTGLLAAIGCFLIWGIVNPIYFKAVAFIDPVEVVAHRVVWTVALVGAIVLATRGPSAVFRAVGTWRRLGVFTVTTALITVNWGVFIWAVAHDRLIETSLGYYINPLVNVLLGVAFLGERLTRRQLAAVAVAAAGVSGMVVSYGALPWVSLVLALTFGVYGLVRKKANIDPMTGLLVETALLFPAAIAYLVWLGADGAFATMGRGIDLLLVLAGPVTAAPLVLYTIGVQRLKLSTIGLLQYIGPTGQLLLGVLVYGEVFTTGHAIAFGGIWIALALFSADAWTTHRAAGRAAAKR